MNPLLQLEADEQIEEKKEGSREQCRGVSGNGGEALTCPQCAQGCQRWPTQLCTEAAHLGRSSQTP